MAKNERIIIVGAGLFGLSMARQLATEGYGNITVLDRRPPPVPEGSSNDISRVVRFDYADDDYLSLAYEAYREWQTPQYDGIFSPASCILIGKGSNGSHPWISKTAAALSRHNLPFDWLADAAAIKRRHPVLDGELAGPGLISYVNDQAGWVNAEKGIIKLRDDCFDLGVSFICGRAGTIVGFDVDSSKTVKAVKTSAGTKIEGDRFVIAAGSWTASLVPMYNSVISTAQVLGYVKLSEREVEQFKDLPIYMNFSTGWFNLPPHRETGLLKVMVHGWGYTRTSPSGTNSDESSTNLELSSPPAEARRERANFAPDEGEQRLREGLREILPSLADRPFEKLNLGWYSDTPTGNFIMDSHPDLTNLFVGGGGSGHAYKFLPVLGRYLALAFRKELPQHLAEKWRFRTEYQKRDDAFGGDGSRAGPARRELNSQERSKL